MVSEGSNGFIFLMVTGIACRPEKSPLLPNPKSFSQSFSQSFILKPEIGLSTSVEDKLGCVLQDIFRMEIVTPDG